MSALAIQCEHVKVSYGSKCVLDNIDLEVPAGHFYGLVGINGSGKTTMIKAILDLIAIDNGLVHLFGKPHRKVSARESLAYLPDRFSPPAHLSSRDFIRYMLALHASTQGDKEIQQMLDALGLDSEILAQSVGRLSKGMTQKLGLMSCLLSRKSLLILDEPMSGLDPKARVLFKKQLFKLKEQGVTVFFSSHVLADVDELADEMAVLHQGKILHQGTSAKFKREYNGENLEEAYINCVDAVE
ncbi:MAG: ABC transporter ATP-binding protein [Gammaproteobacteria bacterium]|nr:ABC transporter ATP-binding protein [Gammaproteobacteria bacterium]